jgi:hypothetical protein
VPPGNDFWMIPLAHHRCRGGGTWSPGFQLSGDGIPQARPVIGGQQFHSLDPGGNIHDTADGRREQFPVSRQWHNHCTDD